MRTVQARTQSTQTIYRSGDDRPAPETSCLYPYKPAAAIISPAAADSPRGQERCWRGIGDRNPLSLFNRPREEKIKSTHMMWYSPLVKPERRSKEQRRFLIIISRLQVKPPNKFGYRTSSATEQVRLPNKFGYRTSSVSLYRKYTEAARRGTGCHGILVPAAPLRDCNFPKGTRANPGIKIHFLFTQSGRKSAGFPVYYM